MLIANNRIKQCSLCYEWKDATKMIHTRHGKFTTYICRDCINKMIEENGGTRK